MSNHLSDMTASQSEFTENVNSALISKLNFLAHITKAGEISWTPLNPSTFLWMIDSENTIASIQKATSPKIRPLLQKVSVGDDDEYLFEIKSTLDNKPIMLLSTVQQPELKDALSNLFSVVSIKSHAKLVNFLDTLLSNYENSTK